MGLAFSSFFFTPVSLLLAALLRCSHGDVLKRHVLQVDNASSKIKAT